MPAERHRLEAFGDICISLWLIVRALTTSLDLDLETSSCLKLGCIADCSLPFCLCLGGVSLVLCFFYLFANLCPLPLCSKLSLLRQCVGAGMRLLLFLWKSFQDTMQFISLWKNFTFMSPEPVRNWQLRSPEVFVL